MSRNESEMRVLDPTEFGALMVRTGHADALIDALTKHYPDAIRAALRIIGTATARVRWQAATC
jgi:phosphotransacetylase